MIAFIEVVVWHRPIVSHALLKESPVSRKAGDPRLNLFRCHLKSFHPAFARRFETIERACEVVLAVPLSIDRFPFSLFRRCFFSFANCPETILVHELFTSVEKEYPCNTFLCREQSVISIVLGMQNIHFAIWFPRCTWQQTYQIPAFKLSDHFICASVSNEEIDKGFSERRTAIMISVLLQLFNFLFVFLRSLWA